MCINVKENGSILSGHNLYWDSISFSNKDDTVTEYGYKIYYKTELDSEYSRYGTCIIDDTNSTNSRLGINIPESDLIMKVPYEYYICAYYVISGEIIEGEIHYFIGRYDGV